MVQIIVFSGCNAGIGFYAAGNLAKRGYRIIAGVRSKEKFDTMVKEIKDEFGPVAAGNFEFVAPLDQCSFESVQQFAAEFLKQYDRLDVLACNAGVTGHFFVDADKPEDMLSKDGIDKCYQTNCLGTVLLTLCLLPRLQESRGRVVWTVSGLHRSAVIDKLQLMKKVRFDPKAKDNGFVALYDEGMLVKVALIYELYRRFGKTGVTFHSFNPGGTSTKLLAYKNPAYDDNTAKCVNTPQKSGLSLLNACICKEGASGEPLYLQAYRFAGCKESWETFNLFGGLGERTLATIPSNDAMNPAFQKKMWEDTINLFSGAGVAVSVDGTVKLP